jgi:hypothetical protein
MLGLLLFTFQASLMLKDVARLSKDVIDSPLLYTKTRDIYCLGIVLLQMLMGKDVMEHFPNGVQSALRACAFVYVILSSPCDS